MKTKPLLTKMSYQSWCRQTGKPWGIGIVKGTAAWCNVEVEPSAPHSPGWNCIEVSFPFAKQLSEEENIEMFFRRVSAAYRELITITGEGTQDYLNIKTDTGIAQKKSRFNKSHQPNEG